MVNFDKKKKKDFFNFIFQRIKVSPNFFFNISM